jgi:hypothetical protein
MMIRVRTPPPMYIVSPSFRHSSGSKSLIYPVARPSNRAGVAELVDAAGLGPVGPKGPWRFKSSRPHSSIEVHLYC